MRLSFARFFLLLIPHFGLAQNLDDFSKEEIRTILFRKNSISFSFSPYMVNKAKAIPLSGPYHLKTIYMNGFEAGPDYHINFNNSYSMIIGLHGGAAARNINFFIPKENFNPNLTADVYDNGAFTREWDFYMNLPISIEKRWLTKNNNYWDIDAGVNIRYYPVQNNWDGFEDDEQDVNGNIVRVLNISDTIGNNLHPWLNYNIGGGYAMLLRNNNYLQCNLVTNFSHKKMVHGTYQINVTGKPPSTGTYSANLSYIGVSFSYIFTGENKRIHKLYEHGSGYSFSQTRANYTRDSLLRKDLVRRSFFGFSISPYIVNKAKATPISGVFHPKPIYMNGFEAGPDYHISLNKNYSIMIGLHGGAAATNYKLFIPGSDFNPSLGGNVDDNGQFTGVWNFYMCVPLWLQKRWYTKRNSFWDAFAGVNVRYYPLRYYGAGTGDTYTDINGNQINVLEINDSIGNNLRPWVNYNIGGGYSWLLRNNNYLQCNLAVNFSDKKIIDGTYQINVTGKPQSTGTYSDNWAYVGLSFSYIFTGANKRLRKMYEEKMKASN